MSPVCSYYFCRCVGMCKLKDSISGFLLAALMEDNNSTEGSHTFSLKQINSRGLNVSTTFKIPSTCKCQRMNLLSLLLNCKCVSGTVLREPCRRLMSVCSEHRSCVTSFCHNYRELLRYESLISEGAEVQS